MNNKRTFLTSLIITALLLLHCGGDDEMPPSPKEPVLTSIELTVDAEYTVTDNPRPIQLEVTGIWDDGSQSRLNDYSIMVDGERQGRILNFNSEEAGTFSLKAVVEGMESAAKSVTVRPALTLDTKIFTVIFHIVHDGEPLGTGYNIEASRIAYQMELLHRTFEQRNRYTPNSTMPMMKFELATTDPDGNTLTELGINRLQRPSQEASVLFQDWMWDHYWDPDYYINVWVGDTKNGYSWGIYPSLQCGDEEPLIGLSCADLDSPQQLEGIALELDNLWEENWVFPHEMGHVFGLFHVFEGHECTHDVDHCADTEQYSRAVYESGADVVTREACNGRIFTSYNIMDYWRQPTGQRDLSYDQVLRMREVIEKGNFRGQKSLADGTPRKMQRPAGG